MRIITLAVTAALGVLAVKALAKPRVQSEPQGPKDLPEGSEPLGRTEPTGRFARGRPSSGVSSDPANSPNDAERLQARHPARALADARPHGLGSMRSVSDEDEVARKTGLADFLRGG
jgi:hypothetical protein